MKIIQIISCYLGATAPSLISANFNDSKPNQKPNYSNVRKNPIFDLCLIQKTRKSKRVKATRRRDQWVPMCGSSGGEGKIMSRYLGPEQQTMHNSLVAAYIEVTH